MKPRRTVALLILAFFILWLGHAEVFAAGQTARAALNQAMAVAQKWQGDAVLVSLSTVSGRPDGTAEDWKYSFYSRKTQKRFVVTARNSGAAGREVNLGYSTESMGNFIDSDAAIQEAKKNGLKGSASIMAVKHEGTGKSAGFYWEIVGSSEKGNVVITLEAQTGKFLKRSASE